MRTCNIVGCPCEGRNEGHVTRKAYDGGFTYYAASYGPRYGDPIGTYVSLVPDKAEDAADHAAYFERRELHFDGEDAAAADIIVWGESSHPAKNLFSPAELREHRRVLLAGETVCLSR